MPPVTAATLPRAIEPLDIPRSDITFRTLATLFVATLTLRAVVFLLVSHFGQLNVTQYANLYDGESYLVTTEAMMGDWSNFNAYHGRVFPGVPALIAVLGTLGVPIVVGGLAINWIAASLVAPLGAWFYRDARVGWAMVMLIPHYLMNSTMTMTEAPLLAFSLSGLILALRAERWAWFVGGVLLGYAGLVRPMACFAVIGGLTLFVHRREWTRTVVVAITSGAVTVGGFVLLHFWRGDALAGAKYYAQSENAYGGELLTWPFKSLIMTPLTHDIVLGRVLMMWAHVAIVLLACGLIVRQLLRSRQDWRDVLSAPWLLANTLFALCIGSVWGFQCCHRFTIPAAPAMFYALRRFLPRPTWAWALIAIASTAFSVIAMLKDLADG